MRKTKKRVNFQSRRANRFAKQYSPIRLCSSKKTQTPVQQTERGETEELSLNPKCSSVAIMERCETKVVFHNPKLKALSDEIFEDFYETFKRLSE